MFNVQETISFLRAQPGVLSERAFADCDRQGGKCCCSNVEDIVTNERPFPPTLEFAAILKKQVAKKNPDWSDERIEEAMTAYVSFLWFCSLSRDDRSPAPDVDEVWHVHILNTPEYVAFCMDYFGHYLHHRPFDVN